MKKIYLLLLLCIMFAVYAWAFDLERYLANRIDVSKSEVTLYTHKKVLFGLSCSSGPDGQLTGLETISVGDVISYKNYSFQVGLIVIPPLWESSPLWIQMSRFIHFPPRLHKIEQLEN